MTVPKAELKRFVGTVSQETLQRVKEALLFALGFDANKVCQNARPAPRKRLMLVPPLLEARVVRVEIEKRRELLFPRQPLLEVL